MYRLNKPILTKETIKAMEYMPNIYIIGQSGFEKYCEVFRTLSYDMLERLKL